MLETEAVAAAKLGLSVRSGPKKLGLHSKMLFRVSNDEFSAVIWTFQISLKRRCRKRTKTMEPLKQDWCCILKLIHHWRRWWRRLRRERDWNWKVKLVLIVLDPPMALRDLFQASSWCLIFSGGAPPRGSAAFVFIKETELLSKPEGKCTSWISSRLQLGFLRPFYFLMKWPN